MKSFSSTKESELYFIAPLRLLQCLCVSPEGGGEGLGGLYCTSVQLYSVHITSQLNENERCIP
jgi:hypothetical protein